MNRIERISRSLVPALIRNRRAVLYAALALSLVASIFAVRLYADLRSGIEELLPESAPSVIAAKSLGNKLRSFSRLAIIVEGPDGDSGDAVARFADELAERLRALPPSLVESVEYRSEEQDAFVRRFGGLYLPAETLRTLRDQLSARVAWEKRAANPLVVSLDDDAKAAPEVVLPAQAVTAHFRQGRWQTPDGKLLVLQVTPPDSSTDAGRNQKLLSAAQAVVQELSPRYPRLQIGYSGEVAELVEEQAALISDLALSTIVVLLLVVLALRLYFRSWPLLAALFGSLAVGCAACFGVSYFAVGHLNANTAFLGSIVVGNGINVGIIFVARVAEERRQGTAMDEAIRRAWSGTLSSTFVAAFGAALAYLSLAATDFRGFSQFGIIGALGMSLCWLSAYLLLPPLLSAIDARRPIAFTMPPRKVAPLARVARAIEARPVAWVLLGALVLAGSALAISRHEGPIVEIDTGQLRAKKSLTSGARFWSAKADLVFHAYLNPVVIRAETPEQLTRTLAALEKRRTALGALDPLGEVRSLGSLVPPPAEQVEKLALLAQIRALLDENMISHLPADQQARVREVRPPADLAAVRFEDLPKPLQRALTERSGAIGTVALAFPRSAGLMNLQETERLKDLVRGAINDADGRSQAINPLFLLSDIDEAIWRDGPRATLIAFALVCLLVLLVVRSPSASITVVSTLLIGLVTLVGLAAFMKVRINFLNFVVLPITFGIGVDYAVNILQRYRHEGPGSISRVLRETGAAVALCSATTIIGYGSLLVADNQALAGFGLLAALGEVTCLGAALLALPAWLKLREPRVGASPSLEEVTGSAAQA